MCLFCKISKGEASLELPENQIIRKSDFFYTKPALGAFIEGYSLVNTNEHIENMKCLSQFELTKLSSYIRIEIKNLQRIYNSPILLFEHGSLHKNCDKRENCIGKCIPHAHIHLVPTRINPIEELKQKFDYEVLDKLNHISSIDYKSYLLISNDFNKYYVFKADERVKSQFVRKLICKENKMKEQWNWVYYPFRKNILNHLRKISFSKTTTF